MTKKILLSGVVGVFIFSGCLGMNEVKPSTPKAKVNVTKVQDTTSEAKDKELDTPPESSMKDRVVEEEIEISDDNQDDNQDDNKPQIIESVQ